MRRLQAQFEHLRAIRADLGVLAQPRVEHPGGVVWLTATRLRSILVQS